MDKAIRLESLMEKGVMKDIDRKRYLLICERIEFLAAKLLLEKHLDHQILDQGYLDLLIELSQNPDDLAQAIRLGASFFKADSVASHAASFKELTTRLGLSDRSVVKARLAFFEKASAQQCHVIEIQEGFTGIGIKVEEPLLEELKRSFNELDVPDEMTVSVKGNAYQGLRQQFNTAIEMLNSGNQGSLNFSSLGHHVITEILNEFVYARGKSLYVPVIYADGSEAPPLPLHVLNPLRFRGQTLDNEPLLKVGMMSARHPEMDKFLDLYWFRNQEISVRRTTAETDVTAYEITKNLLFKTRGEGPYRFCFYQTGFQPAIVGFYRALTEELMERRDSTPTLEDIPVFFLHGTYRNGKVWR